MKNKSAFTLVEVLVVATIVALLAAGGIVSYSQFGKTSRDARRKADVEQVRAALEMYRSNDTNSSYPLNMSGLVNYLKTTPMDPKGPTPYITYSPLKSDSTACAAITDPCASYTLTGKLEDGSYYQANPLGAITVVPPTATPII